jgi:hypothetical protein
VGIPQTARRPATYASRRQHLDRHGRPKAGYSSPEIALVEAARLRINSPRMGIYECSVCSKWHVGRARVRAFGDISLVIELGERAYSQLKEEAHSDRRIRLKVVRRRLFIARKLAAKRYVA